MSRRADVFRRARILSAALGLVAALALGAHAQQPSKVPRFGPFPFQMGGGWGYFVDSPDIGPERKIRIVFSILLPRGK